MTRFAMYSREETRPPKGPWPPLRIFAWTMLWGAMLFWAWAFVSTH